MSEILIVLCKRVEDLVSDVASMGTFLPNVLNEDDLKEEMILKTKHALEDEQKEHDDKPVCVLHPILTNREVKKDEDWRRNSMF